MEQSAQLEDRPHSESLREKNRIRLFRAALCLQLGIAVLTAGVIPYFPEIVQPLDFLPVRFARLIEKLVELMLLGGVICPLLVLWTIFRVPFGLRRKSVCVAVTAGLFVIQIYALLPMVQ